MDTWGQQRVPIQAGKVRPFPHTWLLLFGSSRHQGVICVAKLLILFSPIFSHIKPKALTCLLKNCQKQILFSGFCLNIIVKSTGCFIWGLHLAVFGLTRETWGMTGWIFYFPTKASAFYQHGCGMHSGIVNNCQFSFLKNEFNLLEIQASKMLFGTAHPWIIQLICTIVICTLWAHMLWKYFCNFAVLPIQCSLRMDIMCDWWFTSQEDVSRDCGTLGTISATFIECFYMTGLGNRFFFLMGLRTKFSQFEYVCLEKDKFVDSTAVLHFVFMSLLSVVN